ncbi:hypothetical protein CLV46_1371 [Diaminobutyricimonas aerilata]|uniref:Uncharacterized protein n=1 Tax=Diaminobutyricimonas aerilata TaxID=1162967 RepID=A0A2M9CIX1_9MICO|nr:transposase [Diaminobutyricimonas aerilata]PJJ71818.1 hypothetical protein CLV46_1371 [Diaminobutyricimonas aerilata]
MPDDAPDDALTAIADELYALPLDDFTSERNARAKEVRAEDRGLAQRVSKLTKPSAAAWTVNMFVRHRRDQFDQLLQLGETLRRAQDDLDSETMRTLGAQRRKLIGALGREAASVGADLGHRVSGGAIEEVEQTLQAALADPDAAAAVGTGRLVRSLTSTGFESVDLSGALAGGDSTTPTTRTRRASSSSDSDDAERAERERARERAAARDALEEAQQRADDAEAELSGLDKRLEQSERRRTRIDEERRELEQRLAELEDDLATLDRETRRLRGTRDDAARELDDARTAVDDAEKRMRDLR